MTIILVRATALSNNHISFWEKLTGLCTNKIINNKNRYLPGDVLPQCDASLFLFNELKAQQKQLYFNTIASLKTPHSLILLNRDVCN
jgi:hypothetical protein